MTNTKRHAERELNILETSTPDNLLTEFREELLALTEKFGNSGQSGGSAPYTAQALSQAIKKLCLQEPICPIMGTEDEWMDVSHMGGDNREVVYQNNRCSAIFKEKDGAPYYLDAIIWKNEKGMSYGGGAFLGEEKLGSRQYIKSFPFTPKTFYIDVIEHEVAKDDWEFTVKSPKQLNAVWKIYNKF